MRRFLRDHGLSIVLLTLFLIIWSIQMLVGRAVYNDERLDRQAPPVSIVHYLHNGHFIEATGENWESEFLQMSAFVWLTSFLFQRGSPQSNDPDGSPDEAPLTAASPWAARQRGWVRTLYARSLSMTLLFLFCISFALHAYGGSRIFSEEQMAHGHPPVTTLEYLTTSPFWFESMQNWQSEFLSIAAMVLLSIYLREKNSAESKPVNAPHDSND